MSIRPKRSKERQEIRGERWGGEKGRLDVEEEGGDGWVNAGGGAIQRGQRGERKNDISNLASKGKGKAIGANQKMTGRPLQ